MFVKVISGEHTRLMEKIGVTETIFPERESGVRLGRRISTQVVLNYIPLAPAFGLQEMAVPPDWVGKNLKELQLRQRRGISVVAVHDMLRDEIEPAPDPETPLKESDTLLVAGREEDLSRISEPQNLK